MGILIFLMHLMHIVRHTYISSIFSVSLITFARTLFRKVLMRLYAVLRAAERDIVYILA